MRRTFQYRLFPTRRQVATMQRTLDECRWLYNHLLEQRKAAWEARQETLRLYDQQATLPALKGERPTLTTVHSQVLQNVAVRLDRDLNAALNILGLGQQSLGLAPRSHPL
ncbi:MAG TPA: helix-turn-helix domain-containing protein [Chloroflexota bacterium]|nr:helix-turn-helix domain-containing protein [Chloroflexota bacterium]